MKPSESHDWEPESSPARPSMPIAVKVLLIANIAAYAIQLFAYRSVVQWGGFSPELIREGYLWQFVTYMFLHAPPADWGWMHIAFNMFALVMFGREIEYAWGTKEFVRYYFISGVGAAIFSLVFLWSSNATIIGASGAIYGLLLAFAMMYPNREIILYIFPIKAKYFVLGLGVISILATVLSTGDGVAHLTHLGGLVIGYCYLKLSDARLRFPAPLAWIGRWRAQRKGRELRRRFDEHRELMEEVDRILDRINQVGYEGLTPEERDSLERASKRLSTEPQK